MRFALYSRFLKPEHAPFAQELLDILHRYDAQVYVYDEYLPSLQEGVKMQQKIAGTFSKYADFKQIGVDYVLSLGGDGTILDAVTIVRDTGVPIMGINLGRLGFLAMIEKQRIVAAIDSIYQSTYLSDSRTLLELESNGSIFADLNFALNDFTIFKRDTSSMVVIHTYVNGEFLNSYWADGIIVATPTGSTGYALSCGGPIIFPKSSSFIITPVAPHNLNVRPMVLSDDVVISFEVEGRAKNFLCTLDSRYETITSDCPLAVRKADFKARLIRPNDRNFFYMIREKLHWGIDSRN